MSTIEDAKAFRQRIADACGTAALDAADTLIPKGSRLAVLVIVQDDDGSSMRGSTNVIDPIGICKNVIAGDNATGVFNGDELGPERRQK